MKTKRILACLLAAAMAVPMLAGCGGKDDEKLEIAPVEGFNETGYPVVEEPYTLSVMGKFFNGHTSQYEDNIAVQELEKITNVKLDINAVDQSSFSEKFSVLLAGGELPDIFIGCNLDRTVQQQQMKLGNLIDLKPYIEKYAPNIKKLPEENEEFRNDVTLPTGEIATLPYFQMNLEGEKIAPEFMMVYKPWMDKLGLEMPETTEDFYNVLKAFKEQDPNGNGKADEIPFTPKNMDDFYAIFGMFGIMAEPSYHFTFSDGDTVEFAAIQPEFKEALAYLRKLYAEGLMDKDVFVQNQQQVLAKGSGEEEIIGASLSSAGFPIVGEERGDYMVPTPVMYHPGSEDRMWISRKLCSMGNFAISKECDHPEIAIRWVDYLYSDEGAKLAWMGVEGVSYEWMEDGTWKWIKADGQTDTEVREKNSLTAGIQLPCKFPFEWLQIGEGSEVEVNKQRVWLTENYGKYLRVPTPDAYLDPALQKEVAAIAVDSDQYVKQYIAQVITGEVDLESSWAEYEATCKRMNIDRMVEIYQEAFDKLS
ncbi:MAG: extracellular solute-binding protein [Clostridia bacterium]|nr:extracellular solute-binding protein [Clostridia bacterium]